MVIQDDLHYMNLICCSGTVHIILFSVHEPDNTPYLLYPYIFACCCLTCCLYYKAEIVNLSSSNALLLGDPGSLIRISPCT